MRNSVCFCLFTPVDERVEDILQAAKKKAEPIIAMIKDFISKSPVVGFDESGCYCNGRLDWSWIAQATCYTLVFRAGGRGGKVLEDMFGEALDNMTAVTDGHLESDAILAFI